MEGPNCEYMKNLYNKQVLLTGPILPESSTTNLKSPISSPWRLGSTTTNLKSPITRMFCEPWWFVVYMAGIIEKTMKTTKLMWDASRRNEQRQKQIDLIYIYN
ncbi:hypothetical protein FRX31_008880 [Thalictrum thalictroides]|uniref:Uncharacterized protein n=1 Tax=Thalictrum thalictroides TaxID=46969 RepID=A0A7J6WWW6_THATH|nr:hypothetical protein FRX31_008880 [Thalictrum thalictroides]